MLQIEKIRSDEILDRAFKKKRSAFLEDYELQAKPVLIWQAWPATAHKVDLSSDQLCEAISGGGGPGADDGWWGGFKPYGRPSLVFNGLKSIQNHANAGWVTEVHFDGHLVAGIWSFPETDIGKATPQQGVVDFYVDAFHNFAFLADKVFAAMGVTGEIHLTASLLQADKLALLGNAGRISASAPRRKSLRWPNLTIECAHISIEAVAMADQFMRIYGRKAMPPR